MSHAAETETPQAMPAGRPAPAEKVAGSLVPAVGWHFLHLFYKVDRKALAGMFKSERRKGEKQLKHALDKAHNPAVDRLQCFAVPGHKADFGVMVAGTDLRAIHAVEVALATSALGPALVPSYSFYSITEISEYVPDVAEYGRILRDREGEDPDGASYQAKVAAYEKRLGPMNQQRLYPEFPDWPCLCFYPMSKMRQGDQNWYTLPHAERADLMGQHGKSGMKFAGKVSQVITASTGLDDWEWGVTLWAKNPSYLKDIVYTMRFDESSARYALFGDFYFGMILPPGELLDAVGL